MKFTFPREKNLTVHSPNCSKQWYWENEPHPVKKKTKTLKYNRAKLDASFSTVQSVTGSWGSHFRLADHNRQWLGHGMHLKAFPGGYLFTSGLKSLAWTHPKVLPPAVRSSPVAYAQFHIVSMYHRTFSMYLFQYVPPDSFSWSSATTLLHSGRIGRILGAEHLCSFLSISQFTSSNYQRGN